MTGCNSPGRETAMYRTQGLRCLEQCQNSRRLRPIRGEERTIPVMEFPARNDPYATQQEEKKQRGKL